MFATGILCIYLLLGMALTYFVDRDEMKKDVPYGTMPAVPLEAIRLTFFIVGTLFGMLIFVTVIVRETALDLQWDYRMWRLKHNLRKIAKQERDPKLRFMVELLIVALKDKRRNRNDDSDRSGSAEH
jgi:hypothetical protein